jgi:hypothetical protein
VYEGPKTKAHCKQSCRPAVTYATATKSWLSRVTGSVACATPCPTCPTDTNILDQTARAQGSNAAPANQRLVILARPTVGLRLKGVIAGWTLSFSQRRLGHIALDAVVACREQRTSPEQSKPPKLTVHEACSYIRYILQTPTRVQITCTRRASNPSDRPCK